MIRTPDVVTRVNANETLVGTTRENVAAILTPSVLTSVPDRGVNGGALTVKFTPGYSGAGIAKSDSWRYSWWSKVLLTTKVSFTVRRGRTTNVIVRNRGVLTNCSVTASDAYEYNGNHYLRDLITQIADALELDGGYPVVSIFATFYQKEAFAFSATVEFTCLVSSKVGVGGVFPVACFDMGSSYYDLSTYRADLAQYHGQIPVINASVDNCDWTYPSAWWLYSDQTSDCGLVLSQDLSTPRFTLGDVVGFNASLAPNRGVVIERATRSIITSTQLGAIQSALGEFSPIRAGYTAGVGFVGNYREIDDWITTLQISTKLSAQKAEEAAASAQDAVGTATGAVTSNPSAEAPAEASADTAYLATEISKLHGKLDALIDVTAKLHPAMSAYYDQLLAKLSASELYVDGISSSLNNLVQLQTAPVVDVGDTEVDEVDETSILIRQLASAMLLSFDALFGALKAEIEAAKPARGFERLTDLEDLAATLAVSALGSAIAK